MYYAIMLVWWVVLKPQWFLQQLQHLKDTDITWLTVVTNEVAKWRYKTDKVKEKNGANDEYTKAIRTLKEAS